MDFSFGLVLNDDGSLMLVFAFLEFMRCPERRRDREREREGGRAREEGTESGRYCGVNLNSGGQDHYICVCVYVCVCVC